MGKHEELRSESVDIYSSAKKVKKAKRKKKKISVGKKVAIAVLSVFISILLVATGGLIFLVNYFDYTKTEVDLDALGVNSEDSEEHIVNIALFGIDTRNTESMKGLSDSIMILSVNKETKQLKLISVMRDSVVMVNGKAAKINSAYSKGGAELAIRTLNESFGLDITDYATVNFVGMAELIDVVGGVEAEVTQGEINDTLHGVNFQITEQSNMLGIKPEYVKTPGLQTLNGIQAVSWARIRYQPTAAGERDDYGRTARQRHVINQLFQKAKEMSVFEYPKFIKTMIPYVETSLDEKEIVSLAYAVIKGGTLNSARIPYDNCQIGGNGGVAGGVYYNLDFASELIKSYVYDDITFDQYIEANGIDKTPWR